MKLNIDSKDVRTERKKQWHNWFAWHPVRLNANEVIWLETVRRKGILVDRPQEYSYWKWFYRPKELTNEKDSCYNEPGLE